MRRYLLAGLVLFGLGCSEGEACGDGTSQAALGEQCDDGNTTSGDGCNDSCQEEASLQFTYTIFDDLSDRALESCAQQGVAEIFVSLLDFDTRAPLTQLILPCEYQGDTSGNGLIETNELETVTVNFLVGSFLLEVGLLDANGDVILIGDHPFLVTPIHPGPTPSYQFPIALFPGLNELTFSNPSNESPDIQNSLQIVICVNGDCT